MSNQNNNNNVFDQSRHTVSGHFGLQNVPEIVVTPTLENRMFSENLRVFIYFSEEHRKIPEHQNNDKLDFFFCFCFIKISSSTTFE